MILMEFGNDVIHFLFHLSHQAIKSEHFFLIIFHVQNSSSKKEEITIFKIPDQKKNTLSRNRLEFTTRNRRELEAVYPTDSVKTQSSPFGKNLRKPPRVYDKKRANLLPLAKEEGTSHCISPSCVESDKILFFWGEGWWWWESHPPPPNFFWEKRLLHKSAIVLHGLYQRFLEEEEDLACELFPRCIKRSTGISLRVPPKLIFSDEAVFHVRGVSFSHASLSKLVSFNHVSFS